MSLDLRTVIVVDDHREYDKAATRRPLTAISVLCGTATTAWTSRRSSLRTAGVIVSSAARGARVPERRSRHEYP